MEGIESEFTHELTKVARTLPKKKFCLKLGRYITNKKDPILKSIWYQGRLKKRRFSCKKKISGTNDHYQENNNVPNNENQNAMELMVRLYNQLPLPFQCQVLTSATFNYFDKRRKEHISETTMNLVRQNTGVVVTKQATTKKQLLKHKLLYHNQQLLESIKKVENVLSVHNVLPVAGHCRRLVSKQSAFCKVVQFRVKRNENTSSPSSESEFEMKIRQEIPTIVENYVRKNGIKIGLSLIKQHWVRTLRTLLFVTAKEVESTPEYFVFHVKLFLALGNTGPINGNVVLAALYDYGRKRLSQKMGFDLDFSTSLKNTNNHGRLSHVEQELFMRQTFPRFLDRYFKGLVVTEQNFILNMVSVYTNQTKTKIIHVLQNEHGLKLSNLLDRPRNERRVVPNFSTLLEKSSKKTSGKHGRILTIKRLTNIEIIMVAALSSLVFFGFIFVVVFALFQKRRREFNQRVQELQRITSDGKQSTHQTLLLSENISSTRSSNSSTGINNNRNNRNPVMVDSVTSSEQCESFFTRTKNYSQNTLEKRETLVRSNGDSIGSTDVETLL